MADETLIDGAALAALSLARSGVPCMYGVVGIPVTSLASRAVAAGVRFIAFHNEQSAGYAASAHGYLTGRPGVLLTVSGPGCVHGLAGLSNAAVNAWPMLMISGSCDQADAGRGDFQELDQVEAVKPFSKFSAKATRASEISRMVSECLAEAVSGRPCGCYLDIPSDVLRQTIPNSEAEKLLSEITEDAGFQAEEALETLEIDKAVSILRHAERPLVVFGKGAAFARAEGELKALIERTGIPFLPTPMARVYCPTRTSSPRRLHDRLRLFILVDVSKEEIELRKPCVGLVGDAKKVLNLVNRVIKDDPFCFGRSHPWVEALSKKAKDNVGRMEAQLAKEVVPFNFLTPMRIIRDAILDVGSPAPIVVSEGANTMDVGRAVLVQMEPRTRLDAVTWGTMGVGLGYCIAAAVASPGRLVVAVEGDSGFGFSAMEVETLVRHQLPVIVIVFNNGGVYGGDRRNPDEITGPYKDDPAPTSFVPGAAYHKLIEAFGGKCCIAGTPLELKSALSESFTVRKPVVINIMIDPYAGAESGDCNTRIKGWNKSFIMGK
ncbi:2-hydroxyacyl-CoA lyase [Acorus calamus]|uniref:2-hydroxyacyl-CoA lyase n=1 Tax=Acorus calamus TaxID=4465 RepID=A0AAV9DCN8_ACOCL|nr:2-hydroxyacyl-CoA lyase [Acorus calamus]